MSSIKVNDISPLSGNSVSINGTVTVQSIPQGTTETNIVVLDNAGEFKYRNNLSLQGTAGATGPQGTTGATGPQGTNGTNGTQGTQGIQGIQGSQGIQGATGATLTPQAASSVTLSQVTVIQAVISGITYNLATVTYVPGCVDPESLLEGKDGLIKAADLKIGDEVNSDLGFGTINRIWNSTQPKYIIKTASKEIKVSESHKFIDENDNTITTNNLVIGIRLKTNSGVEEVTEITWYEMGDVIEISVQGTHHYYADGFLSHNKTD